MTLDHIQIVFDIITPLGCLAAFFWGVWQYFQSKSFTLVWEEFYLYDEGLIRKGAWKAWRSGIDQTIHTDFASSVLTTYRNHFTEFDPASSSHKIVDELGIKSFDTDANRNQ